jgi:ABC-type Co2+ transport system permease subunit
MAIPVGLLLQVGLFGHGGFSSLGINSCVLAIPALLAAGLYAALRAIPWDKRTAGRWLLVHLSVFVWTMFAVYGVALLWGFQLAALPWWTHLAALAGSLLVASVAGWYERKMETAPEFPIGLCIGELSVLGALALHCLALTYGGMSPSANQFGQISVSSETHAVAASVSQDSAERPGWRALALFVFIVHVPIAAVEALILGFLVGFLARVKPELIGWPTRDETACTAQSIA